MEVSKFLKCKQMTPPNVSIHLGGEKCKVSGRATRCISQIYIYIHINMCTLIGTITNCLIPGKYANVIDLMTYTYM